MNTNLPSRRYPIGIQTFERIIKDKYVYVDKTDLVWEMANRVKFISFYRPRGFGKSLLTTTLKSYFEGKKELFEGLKIMDYEEEWQQYPVIHIDLRSVKDIESKEDLRKALSLLMKPYIEQYGSSQYEVSPGLMLSGCIMQAYKQTGRRVVVLIDEYDAPLLDKLPESENLASFWEVLIEFYQPLKYDEAMIQFGFLTGTTRYRPQSIFSSLNNIMDVSMMKDYAAICGITEEELTTVLKEDITILAKAYKCTPEEMHTLLKRQYDGYHFSEDSDEIYNPYSLINCFARKKIKNFWFESGTPSFLFHQMQRFGTDITQMDNIKASESGFNRPTETLTNALPLLYQAGYLTIKDYDRELGNYTLGIPNMEVRVGLTEGLLPCYAGLEQEDVLQGGAQKMWVALRDGDIDRCLGELKAFLAGVPYVEGFKKKLSEAATKEGFYEYTFYLILSMLNVYVQTQVKCSTGRVDMIVYAPDTIYLFEFKVKSTAAKAVRQIEEQNYADRFATDPRNVVKVGVNFDIDTWTIEDWQTLKD